MSRTNTTKTTFNSIFPVVTILIGALAVVLYTQGHSMSASSTAQILGSLITAQAAILAIIFSLTFVAIQLTAPRYSPRLNWVFTENPETRAIYIWAGISLLFDLSGLAIVSEEMSALTLSLIGGTGVLLAAGTFLWIILYTKRGLQQTSPDGIIEEFRRRIDTDEYINQVQRMTEDDFDRYHPFRGLYELIINAYIESDNPTARAGLQCYNDLTNNVLAELVARSRDAQQEEAMHNLAWYSLFPIPNQLTASLAQDWNTSQDTGSKSQADTKQGVSAGQQPTTQGLLEICEEIDAKSEQVLRPIFEHQLPYLAIAEEKYRTSEQPRTALDVFESANKTAEEDSCRDLFTGVQRGYQACIQSAIRDSPQHGFSELKWNLEEQIEVINGCFSTGLNFLHSGYSDGLVQDGGELLENWQIVHEEYRQTVENSQETFTQMLLDASIVLHKQAVESYDGDLGSGMKRLGLDANFEENDDIDFRSLSRAISVGCKISAYEIANADEDSNIGTVIRSYWVKICRAAPEESRYKILVSLAYLQAAIYCIHDLKMDADPWATKIWDVHEGNEALLGRSAEIVRRMINTNQEPSGDSLRRQHIEHQDLPSLSKSGKDYDAALDDLEDSIEEVRDRTMGATGA